jgi:hypothetical protein
MKPDYQERTTDNEQATGQFYHLRLSRVHPLCNVQSRARTQAVLVIGFFELLDNQTTFLIEPPGTKIRYNAQGGGNYLFELFVEQVLLTFLST